MVEQLRRFAVIVLAHVVGLSGGLIVLCVGPSRYATATAGWGAPFVATALFLAAFVWLACKTPWPGHFATAAMAGPAFALAMLFVGRPPIDSNAAAAALFIGLAWCSGRLVDRVSISQLS